MCSKRLVVLTMCFWIGCSFLTTGYVIADESIIQEKRMKVTAYYMPLPYPLQKKYVKSYKKDMRMNGGKKTSSGTIPKVGTVAADRKHFPRGTAVYVTGYGVGRILDTGGSVKGSKRLDLFMGEGDIGRQKALDWGVRWVSVTIVKHSSARKG